jgi:hypothetical protein
MTTTLAAADLVLDTALVKKYDLFGPRYTSYPTADRFHDGFKAEHYVNALHARNDRHVIHPQPLSLYVHVPFCNTICYYCACNKVITKDHGRSAKYIKYVGREIDIVGGMIEGSPAVEQLHWGGGTPTFLARDEMTTLMGMLRGGGGRGPAPPATPKSRSRSIRARSMPRPSPSSATSASTGSPSASRISTPRCRRPSTGSRARPRPAS